ncbi:hypothetical protein KSF73_10100 [Burkholderiaceae bacterium DAT-1]|nr:hypothetical protein [Burkholderiaceae bacterium DAT-1]
MTLINAIGAVCLGLGLTSVLGEGGALHPLLASRTVGGMLCLVGTGLTGWFTVDLLKRIQARQHALMRQAFEQNNSGKH